MSMTIIKGGEVDLISAAGIIEIGKRIEISIIGGIKPIPGTIIRKIDGNDGIEIDIETKIDGGDISTNIGSSIIIEIEGQSFVGEINKIKEVVGNPTTVVTATVSRIHG